MHGRQRGQVMVLTALMIVALVGMLGLAIDGGRIYVERRQMQNAADASSLAMADKYWADIQTAPAAPDNAVAEAFAAGQYEFSVETRTSPTGWTPAISVTDGNLACTTGHEWSQTFTQGVYSLTLHAIPTTKPTGVTSGLCVFNTTSSDSIPAAFVEILNGLANIPVQITASALSGHAEVLPTLIVLDTDCSASASDWTIGGSSTTHITGSSISNGNIKAGNGASVVSDGNVFQVCQAFPSSVFSFTSGQPIDPAVALTDPLAQWPSEIFDPACTSAGCATQSGTDNNNFATNVELKPGAYLTNNSFPSGGGCWYAAPGIYDWADASQNQASLKFQSHNTVVSNELTAPGDMPASYINPLTGQQPVFSWTAGGQTCLGGIAAYQATAGSASTGIKTGNYAFRVTSARLDQGVWRESYLSNPTSTGPVLAAATGNQACGSPVPTVDIAGTPSCFTSPGIKASAPGCVLVPVTLVNNNYVQLGISNVPGMGNSGDSTEYRIYATTDAAGCNASPDKFGWVANVGFAGETAGVAKPEAGNTFPATQTNSHINHTSNNNSTGCPYLPPSAPALTDKAVTADSGQCSLNEVFSVQLSPSNSPLPAVGGTTWVSTGSPCSVSAPGTGCTPAYLGMPTSSITLEKGTLGDGEAGDGFFAPGCTGTANCTFNVRDAANENYCATSAVAFCSNNPIAGGGAHTPGGALWAFPSGTGCIDQSQGAPYIFGDLNFQSVVFYAEAVGDTAISPIGNGTCGNNANITGSDDGQFIGQVYLPNALLQVSGTGAPIDGGLDTWLFTVVGGSNTTLSGRFPHLQITTPGHLIVCTNGGVVDTTYCPSP